MPRLVREPISIDFDPDHFAEKWSPIAALVRAILAKDTADLQFAVKKLGDDGLRDLINDLGQLEQRLLAFAEFGRAASATCPRALERH